MQQHGISKLDLKRQNRMQVLKILKQRGPTSRIDIATILGLTRAAVTIITNEMIDQGIIIELGEYKSTVERASRGRKKILIDINQNYKFVLGVCVEENLVSVGLSTLVGQVLDKRNKSIGKKSDYYEITDFIKSSLKSIMTDNCLTNDDLLGIGIGVFPNMYSRMRVSVEHNDPDFIKLANDIYSQFPVPLIFDNSVKGIAMANIDFLPDKDENRHNIAFLQIGNNLHFVVTNLNSPIYSYDNRTNFVDKIIVNPTSDERCPVCGRKGCVQNEISVEAILKKIRAVYSYDRTPVLYKLTGGNPDGITVALVKQAYEAGDKIIGAVFRRVCDLYAVLLNNLYFSTNPQKIVICCDYLDGESYEAVKASLEKIAGEDVAKKVELSMIDPKYRFLSGCALAIRELFYTRGGYDYVHND